jgi:hypothetical protein
MYEDRFFSLLLLLMVNKWTQSYDKKSEINYVYHSMEIYTATQN